MFRYYRCSECRITQPSYRGWSRVALGRYGIYKSSILLPATMKCNKCHKEKPEEEFPFKNKALNKRSSICKECQWEYKLAHYYSNKEAHYERNKKTEQRISQYIDNYKRTHPCSICGESAIECLDFHHLRDKEVEVAKLRRKGSLKKVIEEIDKCVVLCANCHRKVHAGTITL